MSILRLNGRGFPIYAEFRDRFQAKVTVKDSSMATEPCVWIFVEGGEIGSPQHPNDGAAHLTVKQARQVRDALDTWLGSVEGDSGTA